MATTFTAKTVLEFAVMPVQKYEFTCSGCFLVKSVMDYGLRGVTLCKECDR